MTKSIKEQLAAAKLPEKTVPICLRGDLQAQFEELDRQLAAAENRSTDSLAGNGARVIAEKIEALRGEMLEHTVQFRLRAMPRNDTVAPDGSQILGWKSLLAAHPPRKADDGGIDERDKWLGVNADTFFDALVRASVVEPELDADDWATLDGALTDHQFDQLSDAAWGLNRREVDVPFSRAASRILGSGSE